MYRNLLALVIGSAIVTGAVAAEPITLERAKSQVTEPKAEKLTSQRFVVTITDGDKTGEVTIILDARKLEDWAKRTLSSKTGKATLALGAITATRADAGKKADTKVAMAK